MVDITFEGALQAMEVAHNAGDTEGARKLAMLAQSLEGQAAAQPEDDAGLIGQMNRSIAEGVGSLVDFVNPFDKQMGSAKVGMTNLMEAGGVNVSDEAPEGFLENVASGVGLGASALIPVGAGAKALQGVGGLVGQVARTVAPQLMTVGGTAAELAAAAGSSAASGGAREAGYSPTVQQLAGLAGGFAAPLTGLAATKAGKPVAKGAIKFARKSPMVDTVLDKAEAVVRPFIDSSRDPLAIERIQGIAGSKQRAADVADALESNESVLGLSPAQRTGDENLIALERAYMKDDPEFADLIVQKMADADETVRKAIQSEGNVGDAQAFVAQRQADFGKKIDEYIGAAEASAQKKIPSASSDPMQASNIVANELRRAQKLAKEQQKILWNKIPKAAEVDMSGVRETAKSLMDNLNVYNQGDVPSEVATFLKATEASPIQKIGEMNTLSSKLREAARNAMSGETIKANTARIANEVADSIDASFDRIGPNNELNSLIVDARAFTREMNKKFSQGTVGRLLKRGSRGDDRIDPELTLQKTMGQGGDQATVAEQDISAALRGETGAGEVKNATADFLRSQFKRKVFSGDRYSETSAVNFVNDNKALLDKFPEVKAEVQASISSQSDLVSQSARAKALTSDVTSGTSASFAASKADKALDAVMNSKSPAKAMSSLVATAKKDKTGKAMEGLKSAVGDKLLSDVTRVLSKTRGSKVEGAPQTEVEAINLSRRLEDKDFIGVMSQVYSKAELNRLKVLAKELEKVDRARLSTDTGLGLSQIKPNEFVSTLARIVGAKLGSKLGKGTFKGDIQTPGIMAAKLQSIVGRLANDKPAALIKRAMTDEEMFKDLLRGKRTTKEIDQLERKLAPYLTGAVAGQLEEQEQ